MFLRFVWWFATSGTSKSAGLPNITGAVPQYIKDAYLADKVTGAFYEASTTLLNGQSGEGKYDTLLGFDASRSNSIYGASTTVQPPSITMRYYVKY